MKGIKRLAAWFGLLLMPSLVLAVLAYALVSDPFKTLFIVGGEVLPMSVICLFIWGLDQILGGGGK